MFGWGMLEYWTSQHSMTDDTTGDGQQQYDQVYNQDQGDQHDGKFSHELLAGGAAFGAMKVYEDQQRKEGMLSRFHASAMPSIGTTTHYAQPTI